MEKLNDLLYSDIQISNGKVNEISSFVESAFKENPSSALNLLINYFFGKESKIMIQAFATNVSKLIEKFNLKEIYLKKSKQIIEESFWKSDLPSFNAASNMTKILGPEILFENHINDFSQVLFRINPIDIPTDVQTSLGKIIELYIQISRNSPPLEDYCRISKFLFEILFHHSGFDISFTLLRLITIIATVDSNQIQSMINSYSTKLNHQQKILFDSLMAKSSSNPTFQSLSCFNSIEQLLSDNSPVPDRVFGYTSLNQICDILILQQQDSFFALFIHSFLRDFDSSNNLITSSLRTLFKSMLKSAKSAGDTVIESFSTSLLNSVSNLSWRSKAKAYLVPIILPYIDPEKISHEFFSDIFVQNSSEPISDSYMNSIPLDPGFIIKCVRSLAKSLPIAQRLIKDCIQAISHFGKSNNNLIYFYTNSDPLFKPLPEFISVFQPIFECHPKIIGDTFKLMDTGNYLTTMWANFQGLLSCPRTKWPLNSEQIFKLLDNGFSCEHWDIQVAAFQTFVIANMPSNQAEIKLIQSKFENLLLFDSPRHITSIEATFSDLVNRISSRNSQKTFNEQISTLDYILTIISKHMMPSCVSARRQFALNLASSIWAKFPQLGNETTKKALISLLSDSSSSLRNTALKTMKMINLEQSNFVIHNSNQSSIEFNIQTQLERFESTFEEDWETSCRILEGIVSNAKDDDIPNLCERIFSALIKTRKLGLTCRGQEALESLAKRLSKPMLKTMVSSWADRLLSEFSGFDMENMRRSAALPYLAQSIIRLEPPEAMELPGSIFERLTSALINSINQMTNSTEVTHSLNVIRAVLTDKTTSSVAESLLPSVLTSVLSVCLRLNDWDVNSASNLCLGAVMAKALKRNTKEESKALSLDQFLAKMPEVRSALIQNLTSTHHHAQYLALTILSSLSSNNEETDPNNYMLIEACINLLSSPDVRMRRAAARSIVNMTGTSNGSRIGLFKQMRETKPKCFNQAHGQIMALRTLLEKNDNENVFIEANFVPFDHMAFPPYMWDDILYVNQKMNVELPFTKISTSIFSYDESSLFIRRHLIGQDIPNSHLAAVLTKMHLLVDEAQKKIGNVTPSQIQELIRIDDIVDIMKSILNDPEQLLKINRAVAMEGFKIFVDSMIFAQKGKMKQPKCNVDEIPEKSAKKELRTDGVLEEQFVEKLISYELPPFLKAQAIRLIKCTKLSLNEAEVISQKVLKIAYDVNEENSDIRAAIAENIRQLYQSRTGKIIALRLLVDEIPIVRNNAIKDLYNDMNKSALEIFDETIKEMDKKQLGKVVALWLEEIHSRSEWDEHGEPLTTYVDEFFLVRKIADANQIKIDFDYYQQKNLHEIRSEFVAKATEVVEKLLI